MDNPGVSSPLFASAVTAVLAAQEQTPITDLDGMESVTFLAEMIGGSGGTSLSLLAQTTFDGGTTWLDVARFDFLTTAAKKYITISRRPGMPVQHYAALAAEGANHGLLGNQLRAVVTSVGVFTNTTASLRAHVS